MHTAAGALFKMREAHPAIEIATNTEPGSGTGGPGASHYGNQVFIGRMNVALPTAARRALVRATGGWFALLMSRAHRPPTPNRGLLAALMLAAAGAAAAPALARDPPAAAADWRTVDPDNVLILTTSRGQVVVEIAPAAAPATAAHIKALVRRGFYDNSLFYRVLPNVLAQTGDAGSHRYASGDPPVADEFTFPAAAAPSPTPGTDPHPPRFLGSLPLANGDPAQPTRGWAAFCPGVAGLAHTDPPNTGESQIFFMMLRAENLEAHFTAWGRVVIGQALLGSLATGSPPATPDRILTARLAADLPAAERPVLEVQAADGPTLQRQFRRLIHDNNIAPGPCDVTPAARLRPPGAAGA
jgi:peptidylprolyl isomerase